MNDELKYFCIGTALGVAATIILTPKSGPQTRAHLNAKANEGVDYVKARAEDVRSAATDALDRGKTAVKNYVDSVAGAMDAGKQAYQEAVSRSPVG